jgi:uncharacterized protein (TIGR02266 family)
MISAGTRGVNEPTPQSRPALQRQKTKALETEIELDVYSEHNFYTGFSANISDGGGLFVATYKPQAVGDRLRVRFKLPGIEEPIEAKVEVQWIRGPEAGEEGAIGFGGQFVELADDAKAAIERFLAERQPIFYED